MNVIRFSLAIVVIVLSGYSLITGAELLNYVLIFMAIMILMNGVSELQKDKKAFWGYMSIAISFFILYVSLNGFYE